jgi:hypothetical protein
MPVEEQTMTLDERYAASKDSPGRRLALHHEIDEHLKILFPGAEGQPAADVLEPIVL